MNERVQEVEADYIVRSARLEKRLAELIAEKSNLERAKDEEITTISRTMKLELQKHREQQAALQSRIDELERTNNEVKGTKEPRNSDFKVTV